jgi:hypothetical protein
MVESSGRHFYILEPVQLKNLEISIPIFFHPQNDGALLAKCYSPVLKSNADHSKVAIHVPSKISFDDPDLKMLSVNDFAVNNGLKLSVCCGNKMLGEKDMEHNLIKFRKIYCLYFNLSFE